MTTPLNVEFADVTTETNDQTESIEHGMHEILDRRPLGEIPINIIQFQNY